MRRNTYARSAAASHCLSNGRRSLKASDTMTVDWIQCTSRSDEKAGPSVPGDEGTEMMEIDIRPDPGEMLVWKAAFHIMDEQTPSSDRKGDGSFH